MLHSIRWRLIASYVFLAVVTVAVVGFLAMEIIRTTASQREYDELKASAEAIARQVNPMIGQIIYPFPLSQVVRAAAFLGNFRVRVLDVKQNPLADSGMPGEWNELVWIAPPQSADSPSAGSGSSPYVLPLDRRQSGAVSPDLTNLPPGTSTTVIRRSFSPWGGRISFGASTAGSEKNLTLRSEVKVIVPVGTAQDLRGYVELSAGPNYSAEALATSQQAFFLAGAGAAMLAALIGLLMGSRLTSPINQLSATAAVMGSGDLSVRSKIRSKDEIGALAHTFNQMAERLQTIFQQLAAERDALRHFIADASHELRTPITALKNFNALLLGAASNDTQVQGEFLAESQVQIDRLEWITQNLLNLSRIDAGLVQLDRAQCDVGELIQAAAVPFKALANDKGIQLVVNLPEPSFQVECDMARIELAISNLIDNAIKYTPVEGKVEVGAIQPAQGHMRLWVQDCGPGIDPEDLPHIFERFYRGRNVTSPGSGLGLAIVASLVHAHGGKVWAESEPGQGARFFVEI